MDTSVHYTRIYSDPSGESHFSEGSLETKLTNFAPPAPLLNLSNPIEAERFSFLVFPKGYFGDFHPVPQRQFVIFVSGDVESQTSDGESRRFKRSDVVLVEDTFGKGHTARSEEGAILAVTQLRE